MNADLIAFPCATASSWNPPLDGVQTLASALIDIVLSTVKTG